MIPAYQQRVLEEANELKTKLETLEAYIRNPDEVTPGSFGTLGQEEQFRLVRQGGAMTTYLSILNERIFNFIKF